MRFIAFFALLICKQKQKQFLKTSQFAKKKQNNYY